MGIRVFRRRLSKGLLLLSQALLFAPLADAASPESVVMGRQLFERDWSPRNPALVGSDGLGPLFNASSCVACHNQGGVGGGGAAEFNAKTVSIEEMHVQGTPMTKDVVRQAVREFHPGYVDPAAGINNSLAIHHHGGSSAFDASRKHFMSSVPALFSDSGGPVSPEEVRLATATPILYSKTSGKYQTTIRARMFQRNTTPLFGAGLIDQVGSKELRAIEREQKSHPEISGRVSTLPNGRMGRFGWRANVPTLLDFCDQACAAEVGLETRRIDQPADPMEPRYRNPTHDISDVQIRAMAAFVAALPRPTREIPNDSEKRHLIASGEQLFASVGCAVCHRPNLGPASGIYSDLLLHDMGHNNYDLNPADPYVTRVTPASFYERAYDLTSTDSVEMVGDTLMGVMYYGGSYSMEPGDISTTTKTESFGNRRRSRRRQVPRTSSTLGVSMNRSRYDFIASRAYPTTMRLINRGVERRQWTDQEQEESKLVERKVDRRFEQKTASGKDTYTQRETKSSSRTVTETKSDYNRVHLEGTTFTQEWRTPPLWGVRDSAPYMHDGRAETLLEAISMHEGEAQGTRDRFLKLSQEQRRAIIAFLESMIAPENALRPAS